MLLATLPCRSLVLEELVKQGHQNQEAKQNFSPVVSLLRPLLFKLNIMPTGQGKILKDPRPVFGVGERMNLELKDTMAVISMGMVIVQ